MKATIHNAALSFDVRMNGESWLSASGINTRQSSTNAYVNQMYLVRNYTATVYVDDVYILDTAGATCNGFPGDVRISVIAPNDDGASAQWTCSTGSSHYQLVDENPYSLMHYLYTRGLNNIDLLDYVDISGSPTIIAVAFSFMAYKDDAGARSVAGVVRHSGTNNVNGTNVALSSTASWLKIFYETNPGTGAAWLVADFNAAQFGLKLTA